MKDDPKSITVQEALERFKNGETTGAIAKELGVNRSTISRRLNSIGYRWDKLLKVWTWDHDEPQPLDDLLYVSKSGAGSKPQVNTKYIQKEEKDLSNKINTYGLSQDDIMVIKDLLKDLKKEKEKQHEESLHQRIMGLSVQERRKRTMVLTENAIQLLDDLAKKTRFNKSDLLEVAIQDLYKKYGNS